jgi:hypothetical protein
MVDKNTEATAARTSLGLIREKLLRARTYLIETNYRDETGLRPEVQWAVRILESRVRTLERHYLSRWGTEREQRQARIELSLRTPDTGQLWDLGERRHTVGRLDCRACCCNYTTGYPVTVIRLCPSCGLGLQHTFEVPEGVPTEGESLGMEPTGGQGQEMAAQGQRVTRVVRYYQCENCGKRDETGYSYFAGEQAAFAAHP